MFRSPSLPLLDNEDLSSIDPLAVSTNDENCIPGSRASSPVKLATSPVRRPNKKTTARVSTPPRGQRKSDIVLNSPSRTVTEHMLSPWKIRVTVEAEQDSDCAADTAATTRTTRVPLKPASSPTNLSGPKRRGRASETSPTKNKRVGAPVRGRSNSRSRRQSVTDLDIVVLGDDGDSNDWTKRYSPKKKKRTFQNKAQSTVQQEEPEMRETTKTDCQALSLPKRRKSVAAEAFEIHEDTDVEDLPSTVEVGVTEDSPELRKIDLNKVSVRPRATFSRQKALPLPGNENLIMAIPGTLEQEDFEARRQVSDSSARSYPTPEPSSGTDTDKQDVNDDPTDRHDGYDTILDSEGFTMIDLESIPSARNLLGSPVEDNTLPTSTAEAPEDLIRDIATQQRNAIQATKSPEPQPYKCRPSAIPSYLTLAEGESEISSNVPSSPPAASHSFLAPTPTSQAIPRRQVTPRVFSSPKIPSPPRQPTPGARTNNPTPPSLARVVRAGITLQGLLSPKPSKGATLAHKQRRGTPEQRLDELFDGFDSGIRRELRAGLRFGEELAKRQRLSPQGQTLQSRAESQATLLPRAQRQVWRGETTVRHTPRQTADMVDQRSLPVWEAESHEIKKPEASPSEEWKPSTPVLSDAIVSPISVSNAHEHRERQWQLQREAVSRQIDRANVSKVVVIDDDDEEAQVDEQSDNHEAGPEGDDIWLTEAAASNDFKMGGKPTFTKTASTASRRNVFRMGREVCHDDNGDDTLDKCDEGADISLTNNDVSGMLWQESKHGIKFGARQIEREKRQLSDSSPKEEDEASALDGSSQDDGESIGDSQQEQAAERGSDEHLQAEHGSTTSLVHENDAEPQEDYFWHNSPPEDEPTSSILPPQSLKLPVNFNDSSVCEVAPQLTRSSPTNHRSSPRPCTPRSALKGGRASLGLAVESDVTPPRKVIFSEARFLDEDGIEESRGIKSASVSLSPASVVAEPPTPTQPRLETQCGPEEKEKGSWLGWLRGASNTTAPPSSPVPHTDGLKENNRQRPATSPTGTKSRKMKTKIPSYLTPPSYPSLPGRSPHSQPLFTTGPFTRTHWRTLHIIHAKSERPRFHAPTLAECRSDLRACLGMKFTFDESQAGMGAFEWVVNENAVRVVERFRHEVEMDHISQSKHGDAVKWGWTAEELCWYLGRIVVGEIVRTEEQESEMEVSGVA